MNSVILTTTGRVLLPWLFLLSLIVVYRGHNLPGGGFIGGLTAAGAVVFYMLGSGVEAARKVIRVAPESLMGVGLLLAVGSGLISIFTGDAFMRGLWLPGFSVPGLGKVHLGTPLVFDIGVYLVVIGFTLLTTFSLKESQL